MSTSYKEVSEHLNEHTQAKNESERAASVRDAFAALNKIDPGNVSAYLFVVIEKEDEDGHSLTNLLSGGNEVTKEVLQELVVDHYRRQRLREQH